MNNPGTNEPQYQSLLDLREKEGLTTLGLATNIMWHEDPRRLLFMLARYKFVSKMLAGKSLVLEVGCGDGFGARVVLQEVGAVCAVDFDPIFVKDVNDRLKSSWRFECKVHDILSGPVEGRFDAAYSLDVLEHVDRKDDRRFISNIVHSLAPEGILIVGMPSLQSQAYASERSREGHVNCKDSVELKDLMREYFHNVFMFSMNDEIVHTGFSAMAHYLIAMGVGRKT